MSALASIPPYGIKVELPSCSDNMTLSDICKEHTIENSDFLGFLTNTILLFIFHRPHHLSPNKRPELALTIKLRIDEDTYDFWTYIKSWRRRNGSLVGQIEAFEEGNRKPSLEDEDVGDWLVPKVFRALGMCPSEWRGLGREGSDGWVG